MSSSNGSVNGLLHEGDAVASGYQVLEHLSRGRALDVYDAWSLERDCRCVAKVVRPDRQAPRVRKRLVREGELLLGSPIRTSCAPTSCAAAPAPS
jgi:hypothetical protein